MVLKIIIVDDHPTVRKGLKQILTDEFIDVQIREAGTAEELLKLITLDTYSLVICDITMPGRSGIDVVKHLHTEYPKIPGFDVKCASRRVICYPCHKSGCNGIYN